MRPSTRLESLFTFPLTSFSAASDNRASVWIIRHMSFDIAVMANRVKAFYELPWVLPATTVIQFTDEDLDQLEASPDADTYWHRLNAILRRIEESEERIT